MPKTIKVYALPSHQTKDRTSGVDFVRVIQPMEHLDGYVLDDYKFEVKLFDIHAIKQDDWVNIAKEYDMVFLNYTVLDWAFAYMGAPMRGEGKKMIMDIDDAISHVRKDNPTYQQYQANNGKYIYNVNCMLNEVDYVTTTTPYLRNVLVDETSKGYDKIRVIPNCIDLKKYHWRFPPTKKDKITLMYFGSTTHFEDLLQKQFTTGVDRLMEEIPNLQLVTVGAFIPELRDKWGMRYVNDFGDTDVYKWIEFGYPKFMEAADIVVSPLEIDTYNRSKSFIKYLEYSAAKKPGVYQDINQYRDIVEHGKNGFLAQTADNWYTHIKALVTDIDLRKKIGNAAFKTAQEYQIKDWVKKYAELFKSCVVDDKQ